MTRRGEGFGRVEELFHRLVEKSEAEKSVLLTEIKSTEPEVYELLFELLRADSNPDHLFANNAQGLLEQWTHDPELVGGQIGAFRLDEIVGQGAMGSVFRASRVDGQFDQTVAIKLLKSQLLSGSHREFFERERQILAKLNHPGIARLYDGGFVEDGRPFFTMEWISGHSLIRYAELNSLGLSQRIGLFIQVCEAIRYAHQSLVVHLDLKPANIIVNDSGTVKLLDFGVSRLLEDNLEKAGSFTLAYASPEQIRRESANTVSDIYSLGVILVELLADHPYSDFFKDINLLKTKVLTGESKAFRLNPELGHPPFEEDLITICKKAMNLDPELRYGSVDELINDLRAFEGDYPISIRDRDWQYVGRKYFRRNRKVLASIGVAAVLLVGTGIFYTVQLQDQRNIAQAEAKRANQISGLLTDVFLAADPNIGGADTITAVNLLDQGLSQLEKNLSDDPELLAEMQIKMSSIYYNLGQYDKGTELAKSAYFELLSTPDSPDELLIQAEAQFGKSYYYYGLLDSAELYIGQALDRLDNSKSKDGELKAGVVSDFANVKNDLGRILEADSLFRLAHSEYLKIYEGPNADLAFTLHMMGSTARDLGKFNEAEQYLMGSLEMKKELFEEPHLEIAYTYNYLGSLYQSKNEDEKALDYITKSYDQRKAILGEYHVETMASLSNMGRSFNRLGRFEEAISIYDKALEIVDSLFGKTHLYTAGLVGNQSNSFLGLGDYETAKEKIRETQRLYRELSPSNQLRQVAPLIKLGQIAEIEDDFSSAKTHYEQALAIREEFLPAGHFQIAQSQLVLGKCLINLEEYTQAIDYLEHARQTLEQNEDSKGDLFEVEKTLLQAYQNTNDEEKVSFYQKVISAKE